MGNFSWCFCDMGEIKTRFNGFYDELKPKTQQRLRIGESAYVLFPKEFGGKDAQIHESMYDGYGNFNKKDIYDLVADWNREWIANHPEWIPPHSKKYAERNPEHAPAKPISTYPWYPYYSDLTLSRKEVVEKCKEECEDWRMPYLEYRSIGIDISCYDEDNASLLYPIKIAKHENSVYEDCPASYRDPGQGF